MKFINRYVLLHASIVLIATLLLYYAIDQLPENYSGTVSLISVAYALIIFISAFVNNRRDEYQGFFGLNYHLVTYIICNGLPLALHALGYLPDISFVAGMAANWGIGLAIHAILFIVRFRKRKLGNYDKQEIFQ